MLQYIVNFLAVAAFPLALAGYGGHLATEGLEGKKKRNALWLVWLLAGCGVLAAAWQQINSYRSDSDHNKTLSMMQERLADVQSELQSSRRQQAYATGQLDTITLMIGKIGERNSDPGLRSLAEAINRIAQARSYVDSLRREVVALIRDLKTFQSERTKAELQASGSQSAIAVGSESIRLFRERFSERLRRLVSELPNYLALESRLIRQTADTPIGSNSEFLQPLINTLQSVSASL